LIKFNIIQIVMELCDVGSLKSHMKKTRLTYTERQIGAIIYNVLLGLEGMHKLHMIHRDIKADNVNLYFFDEILILAF
jgi:serine/threonine protein kinase